jgi:hypothetical protein
MMCFWGGGVGHASTRKATDFFKQDRDSRDAKRVLEEDRDDEDYDQTAQTQYEPTVTVTVTVPNCANRDDEEEDYGYNRGQFSETDEGEEEEEAEEVYSDDEFGPKDDGGDVDEFMDNLG